MKIGVCVYSLDSDSRLSIWLILVYICQVGLYVYSSLLLGYSIVGGAVQKYRHKDESMIWRNRWRKIHPFLKL